MSGSVSMRGVGLAVLLGGAAAACAARAEEPPAPVGEVVVTAKQAAPNAPVSVGALGDVTPLETPFSTRSFDEEFRRNIQATNLQDFTRNDPAATNAFTAGTFFAQTQLRGFAAENAYDGIGSLRSLGSLAPITWIDRVDVLKGPASLLTGASAIPRVGGLINSVPKTPGADPVTVAEFQAVEGGFVQGSVDVSRRFGPDGRFGLRLNAAYGEGDDNLDDGFSRKSLLDLTGTWQVTPTLKLTGTYHYDNARQIGEGERGTLILDPGVPVPRPPDPKREIDQPWAYIQYGSQFVYGRADWTFAPDWTLTVKALDNINPVENYLANSIEVVDAAGDTRLTPFVGGNIDRSVQETNWAVNGRLEGRFRTGPFTHNLVLQAGVSYLAYDASDKIGTVGDYPTISSSLYTPVVAPRPVLTRVSSPYAYAFQTEAYTAFDRIDVGRGLSILGGLTDQVLHTSPGGVPDMNQSAVSPILGLNWQATPRASLYVSYAESLQRGSQAPDYARNANQFLPPAITEQVEVGGKLEVGGALLSAAWFDISQPLTYLDTANGAAPYLFGEFGTERHRGVEANLAGRMTPALFVSVGAMYIDATQEDTGDPSTNNKRASGVPKFTAPVYVDWSPAFLHGLALNAGFYHFSGQWVDPQDTQHIPGYTRVDLGARYPFVVAGRAVTARVNVQNVSGMNYYATAGGTVLGVGEPRTVRVSLTAAY